LPVRQGRNLSKTFLGPSGETDPKATFRCVVGAYLYRFAELAPLDDPMPEAVLQKSFGADQLI
jgi:hypothetical protein